MTLEEYIKNPQGGKNSVFTNRNMFVDMYQKKLDAVLVREGGKLQCGYYIGKNKYYIHIKVPSEVIEKFYYDVVFELDEATNLEKTDFKVYSNSPSFVFTFAYAFNKHKMFIDFLAPRMDKLALTKRAVEKNPNSETGYEKSIVFAYLYLKNKNMLNPITFKSLAKPFSSKEILRLVQDSKDVYTARLEAGREQDKLARIKKDKEIAKANVERKKPAEDKEKKQTSKFAKKATTVKKIGYVKKK